MTFGSRPNRLVLGVLCFSLLSIAGSLVPRQLRDTLRSAVIDQVNFVAPGWTVDVVRQLADDVTALVTVADSHQFGEDIYIGTGGSGAVYRLHRGGQTFLRSTSALAIGLGDTQGFCDCRVNRLAICDLDHDGIEELIAETSQILPRGQPRLYVWSLTSPPAPRGFARPPIASSWGHGVAIVHQSEDRPDRILSTYCGFGEVIEYQLASSTLADGFHHEGVAWRLVGQLPASGEAIQVADADNDGERDLCLATGFEAEQAAIWICALSDEAVSDHPKLIIDENRRFGTVEFVVGSVSPDGSQDVFAWWCVGLGAGQTELIRYRLGPQGIVSRLPLATASSDEIWPIDGQTTLADMDGDGDREVWFATASGRIWRYAPSHTSPLQLVCQLANGIGPIAPGGSARQPRLYFGSGPRVLQLLLE